MEFHSNKIVKFVRKGRVEGLSLKALSKKYGISDSTVYRWTYGIKSENKRHLANRQDELKCKSVSSKVIGDLKFNKETAKLLAALLYWCEGSKYPSSSSVVFTNSDARLIKTFLTLFKKGYNIDIQKIKIHLQFHDNQNKNELVCFWSKLTGVSKNNFYNPTITKAGNKRKRDDYKGTCTLKYHNVRILWEIMGIYELFSNKHGEMAEWLKAAGC